MLKFTQITLILAIVIAISSKVNSFTKYGRGCQDIGCLPNEVCVMAQDSCNLGQRDGKECGTYPTCKRNGAKPADSNIQQSRPTFNTNTNADSGSPYGGSNSGNAQSSGGLYPSLPNQNNNQGGGGYYPGVNSGGYVPPGYNPNAAGGHQPPQYGGGSHQPPQYGGGGYQPQPHGGSAGGYNPNGPGSSGGGGYNRGGYSDPNASGGQKDKGNGFLSGILSNPHVSSAISGIIAGQIQKAITGGGGRNDPQSNRGGYGGGNDGYGGGGGSSSGSSGGSNIIGGLISGYLSGGGGGNSQPARGGGSSGGLGLIGDLLGGGGGSNQRGSSGGGGGGISDFFKSKNLGGLFNENPNSAGAQSSAGHSNTYSSGRRDYPTQPPYNYNG